MEELTLHKVAFTEEAIFDYEHCLIMLDNPSEDDLPLFRFPKQEIKAELEEYIQGHSTHKNKHYFRVRHYCEQMDADLLLFIKRGWKLGTMQNWTVVGICWEWDWTEDMEDDGIIRAWYETKITDLDDTDWVEEMRLRQREDEAELKKDEKERNYYAKLFD